MTQILQEPARVERQTAPAAILAAPAELPRVLASLEGGVPAPTLLCVAGLHGNEPLGVVGLRRVLAALESDRTGLEGRIVGLTGNRRALAEGRRFIDRDLNRSWNPGAIAALRRGQRPATAEDEELLELESEVREVLATATGDVFLLDLHTISGPGPAFAIFEDTLANRRFAFAFPVPLVLGLEEEVTGTLSNYLCSQGVVTLGFEAGQHTEPAAADRTADAVWLALEASGVLRAGSRPQVEEARRRLRRESGSLPHLVEVRHRHPIRPEDGFRMAPGFVTFQRVRKGQAIAADRRGTVRAGEDALLLMPLYQQQGDDGFFLVRRVRPVWLRVSAVLRRLRLERHLHRLPGVHPHPERPLSFIVDRRVARWLTLELFHLLGFRRVGRTGRFVALSRRLQDL